MIRFIYISGFSVLMLLACAGVHAQNVTFVASANTGKMGVKDQVNVTYTISFTNAGTNIKSVNNLDLRDFTLIGGPYNSTSESINMTGNSMVQTESTTLTYRASAKTHGQPDYPCTYRQRRRRP